ncbi:MAG TPA: hypothetical protein VFV94_15690 [Polyangiaceae bacterium]|nr:hypothetical protein [Polyangiaceae bacterium]
MKRLAVGIALAVLLPNCIQENPVAEEQKTAEQTLRESIAPFCDDICQRGRACDLDFDEECPDQCREYMTVFVDHGEACVTLGQNFETCVTARQTCEELASVDDCDQNGEAHDQCKLTPSSGPPSANPPIYCADGGGTSAGKAPGANGEPPMTTSCDSYFEGCSDGASRRVSCHPVDGALVCNCFRDGVVNGVAFTPASGDCPWEYDEVNEPCGWNLQY